MAFALSGIASGLDSATMIKQLIQLEAMPQTALKTRSSNVSKAITALQGLNTRTQSVADAAKKLATGDLIKEASGKSSDASISVSAGKDAVPASLNVKVTQLASAQTSTMSAEQVANLPLPPTLTVTVGNKQVTLEPATGTMEDVAKAINAAKDLGLQAVMVKVGAGDSYALQITGKTGTDSSFTIEDSNGNVLASAETATVKAANAKLEIPGVGATLESQNNTFEGVMPGVNITVSKVTAADAEPANITVERSTKAASDAVRALVNNTNVVLQEIASQTKGSTKVEDGRSVTTPGTLSGDAMMRGLGNAMTSALSYGVDGKSPSQVGITLGRDGTFTFDEAKLAEALKNDPEGTNQFLTKLAARVQTAAEGYADKHNGQLTTKIKSQESMVKSLDNQVAAWDIRLDNKRTSLERTYNALEVAMSRMQGQHQWMAGQLASLPGMYS